MILNPDTLMPASGDELKERQARTGEIGNGLNVFCVPDPQNPWVIQQVGRATCLTRPFVGCTVCPHSRFELIYRQRPAENVWVLCPRWEREEGTGPPSYYTVVLLSECRVKPFGFCARCPEPEELLEIRTDKQKHGWLERYRKLTREE